MEGHRVRPQSRDLWRLITSVVAAEKNTDDRAEESIIGLIIISLFVVIVAVGIADIHCTFTTLQFSLFVFLYFLLYFSLYFSLYFTVFCKLFRLTL